MPAFKLAFTHDGDRLIVMRAHQVYVCETRDLNRRIEIVPERMRVPQGRFSRSIRDIALTPDGQWLGVACHNGTVHFYDTTHWRCRQYYHWVMDAAQRLAFSEDNLLAVVGSDSEIRLWDREF
jgi:WD40 repeat protein